VAPLAYFFLAMVFAAACSAFFSASEAALFSLRGAERRALPKGNSAERTAALLLEDPDRLLSGILFWNLLVNLIYFAVTAQIAQRLGGNPFWSALFSIGSLLFLILSGEMFPKTIGVLLASSLARVVAIPIATLVRIIDPIMPLLRSVNRLSQKLLWPGLQAEQYLDVSDLERAIDLTVDNKELIEQEQHVLRNIVQLSRIRVDEWMRPRSQFETFHPPVSLEDLEGKLPASGYLLITEEGSEEVEFALRLSNVHYLPSQRLEQLASRVIYVPWCAMLSSVLEKMRNRDRDVAVVVNEFGETIGIITIDDVLETIFTYEPSRSKILLDQNPVHILEPGRWLVSGMTSLRKLKELTNEELPNTYSVTVSGVIQESLQRIARPLDLCVWGPFRFLVKEMPQRGEMLIEMELLDRRAPTEEAGT
jgi:putative hemolysin